VLALAKLQVKTCEKNKKFNLKAKGDTHAA